MADVFSFESGESNPPLYVEDSYPDVSDGDVSDGSGGIPFSGTF